MPVDSGVLVAGLAVIALLAIVALIVLVPFIVWSSARKRRFVGAWIIVAAVLVVLAVVGGAVGMHHAPPPIRPIARELDITDRDKALTVTGFHLSPPVEGTARLEVRVRNASDQTQYLGVEYYVDAGHVSDIFSPGASGYALVEEVAPQFSGTVVFALGMPPLARKSSLVMVLARCKGPDAGGTYLDPDSEALYQERFPLTVE